ncbi:alpha/beta hydrolase [Actinomadura madurae]
MSTSGNSQGTGTIPRTETTRLRDIDVRYRVSGQGSPVLMAHGLAEDHLTWRPQQEALAGYRTYAYDLRGHGGTTLGAPDGTPEQLRDDLLEFLARVTGPAPVVGFSLGGTIALAAAARDRRLVTGVIALGASTKVGRAAAGFYAERIGRAGDRARLAQALREDSEAGLHDPSSNAEAVGAARVAAIGDGVGYANAAAAMAALHDRPLTPALAGIRCPVTVIGGEYDTFCPRKAADIILTALPQAEYREISGAGHLMNIDRPDAVTAAVREALEGMS